MITTEAYGEAALRPKQLNVILCWHMHQPYYREGLAGAYHLPWVYLHGIKDYSDMAAHLERYPAMHVVVNFAPVLLEQLDDYAQQLDALLKNGVPTQDHMLNFLGGIEPIPTDPFGLATKKAFKDGQAFLHVPARTLDPTGIARSMRRGRFGLRIAHILEVV